MTTQMLTLRGRRAKRSWIPALMLCLCLSVTPAHAEGLAVTFDDLPLNGTLASGMTRLDIVKRVLAILRHEHVPQVYGFVNGVRFEDSRDGADALLQWVAGGQRVGNHTYSHSDLGQETADAFMLDVRRNEPALQLLDHGEDWRWLRYPFLREGDTLDKRRDVRAQLQSRGYRIAQVTIDYEDYLWNSAYSRCEQRHDQASIAWLRSSYLSLASAYIDADRQMAQILFNRSINHVLLLHLGAFSPEILPALFQLLRQKGFTLMTLEQAQRDAVYATDPDAGSKNGGTLLEQWLDARSMPYPPAPEKPYQRLDTLCR